MVSDDELSLTMSVLQGPLVDFQLMFSAFFGSITTVNSFYVFIASVLPNCLRFCGTRAAASVSWVRREYSRVLKRGVHRQIIFCFLCSHCSVSR